MAGFGLWRTSTRGDTARSLSNCSSVKFMVLSKVIFSTAAPPITGPDYNTKWMDALKFQRYFICCLGQITVTWWVRRSIFLKAKRESKKWLI
jgi:hypothetical protein